MNAASTTSSESLPAEWGWKLKLLLLWHLVIALTITSFICPFTKIFWEKLDIAFFQFLNGSLEGHKYWQIFWALANHKMHDWLEDIVILCFFVIYIRNVHKQLRARKASELFFCIVYIAAIIYFINRILFRKFLHIPRQSPTLILDSCVRLSEEIPWLSIKDDSSKSFPGDHATTALLFAASFSYIAGWRFGILASLYAAFLCLPRLITGAHWLSDVIVGSGCITMFFLSWAFCTPFHLWITNKFKIFINFLTKTKQKRVIS
jgi:Kdo2-lipid A phosphotransferase